MRLDQALFCTFLCISLTKAQFFFFWSDEEYYTTTVTTTYEIYPQDDMDAKTIVDGGMKEEAFASILPYREKIRRMTIIREIGAKSGGVDYIADNYVPQQAGSTTFKDLVYALTKNENMVLGGYLEVYFERKDEDWIIIPMVLTKNMQQMIQTYDNYHSPKTFKHLRKDQRCPFENMLRVWVRDNRALNEKGDIDKQLVTQDVNSLRYENDSDGWKENRDQLENILIKKSIRYAQAVIKEFEVANGNKTMESIIKTDVDTRGLNHDLGTAYSTLASYIKNKHAYIASIMSQHCDGSDKWAAWIMCIAVVTPEEWPKVNAEFKKANKGDSLSKFILQKMTDDKVMAEMIAAIVDSNFKPTTFKKVPLTDGAGPASTPSPAPTSGQPTPTASPSTSG